VAAAMRVTGQGETAYCRRAAARRRRIPRGMDAGLAALRRRTAPTPGSHHSVNILVVLRRLAAHRGCRHGVHPPRH
jgi:hypothetical protein